MRGVVSAGMVTALSLLGAGQAFDLALGVSAGASNAFAFCAGTDDRVAAAYYGACVDGPFLSARRAALGRGPLMDLEVLAQDIVVGRDDELVRRADASGVRLGFVATDVETAAPVVLEDFADAQELRTALRASSLLPGIAGAPVELKGRLHVDGTITESIPYPSALRLGATHVLVLQTRPVGVPLRRARGPERLISARALRRLGPQVEAAYAARPQRYAAAVAELAERSADGAGPPFLATIRPAAGTPPVGQLERSKPRLRAGARSGALAVHLALTGGRPWLDGRLATTLPGLA
ncbi:unannotated protein [freshwater metagenome]|uniref:Unannotated protein n=1 Tax=freshwater metagenome TaxID=449393 RepID=A0A6J7ENG1_9ZZZZ